MRRDDVPLSQRLLARPEEAAAMLGVGRSTVYEMMRLGELPVVHIGRAARIPMHALRRWVEQHDAPGAAEGAQPPATLHATRPALVRPPNRADMSRAGTSAPGAAQTPRSPRAR